MEERLQKLLARAGVASRRHAEELITEGKVRVNGTVIRELGSKADPEKDLIEVGGQRLAFSDRHSYLLLYKPRGVVTTAHDPEGRPTVIDLVRDDERLFPVGRLDMDTEGLLLMTNDGELAYYLTHPSHEVAKTYEALVQGIPTQATLSKLAKGVVLEDGLTAPAETNLLRSGHNNAWVALTIHEGRNRQVRRMLELVGHPVLSLKRTRLGFLTLDGLAPGQYRKLSHGEVKRLREMAIKSLGLRLAHHRGSSRLPQTQRKSHQKVLSTNSNPRT